MILLSRAKPLQHASVFLIKPLVGSSSVRLFGNQPSRAAISSILGYVSCASIEVVSSKRDGERRLCWWCSRMPYSCRAGEIGNRYLSTVTAATDAPTDEQEGVTDDISVNRGRWYGMFDELKEYKSIHGDTLVPARYPENPSLGNWVDYQRQSYRMRLELEKNDGAKIKKHFGDHYRMTMTDEKIDKLNSIDFVWNPYDHFWNIKYEELKEYIAEHGNSLVPWQNYPPNPSLAVWVATQRRLKHKRQKEKDLIRREVILSGDRIQKLDEVGFVWEVFEIQWLERLEELKLYKTNHGDTLVPKHYSPQPLLGRWVDKQRLDYRRYMDKKKIEEEWGDEDILDEEVKQKVERLKQLPTGMTERRIRLLEAEDFIWSPNTYAWELKFTAMCDFVAMNGHGALFRRSGGTYDPLARWAEVQRANYKKHMNGEKTRLTEERIARLNSIHFVWENNVRPATSHTGKAKITSKPTRRMQTESEAK